MLKSALDSRADLFQYLYNNHFKSITVNRDIIISKFFEMNRILDKYMTYKGRYHKKTIQYLIRFKRYELEDDKWYIISELNNAQGLINDYKLIFTADHISIIL